MGTEIPKRKLCFTNILKNMKRKLLLLFLMTARYSTVGIFIQCLLISIAVASDINAQQVKSVKEVVLELEFQNARLIEVFSKIESLTDYEFVYHENDLPASVRFNLSKQKIAVGSLLMKLSEEAAIAFRQQNQSISVKKVSGKRNKEMPLEIIIQTHNVTGRITSAEDGEALPGVNVIEKGTNNGTVTNLEGVYQLSVSANAVLIFSSVGFTTEEISVDQRSVIDVVLIPDVKALEEIVVVGYATQTRGTITGAIGNVSSDELKRTTTTNTAAAIVGKIPGVTARASDARPGNATNIQIRNLGAPLYVIDGIPYGANRGTTAFGFSDGVGGQDIFNNLSIDDIESITVLKDASAAIYGFRASNGVVLVTTKKGAKSEKPMINISGYYGFQNFTRFPKPANAYQYMRGLLESEQNLAQIDMNILGDTDRDPSKIATSEELERWRNGTNKSYDYFDEVMRPNVPQYYLNANTTGGTDKINYYLSVSHVDQDAIIKDFSYRRTNLQSNIEAKLSNALKVGTQLSARLEKMHNVGVPGLDDFFNPFLSVFTMWPTESPYANDNPKYINQTHNVNVNPATYKDEVTGWADESWRGMNINLFAEYSLPFGLTAKGTYSYNYTNEDFEGFEYIWDAYTYNPVTEEYETGPGYGNQNPWREKHKRSIVGRYMQFQLNYEKQIGSHNISAVAGYERSDNENTFLVIHTVPPNNYIPLMKFSNQDYLDDQWRIEARAGYIGRLNYNYDEKYLLELVGRYDGSFLYQSDDRWGIFPGISAGWRLTEEPFMETLKGNWLNELKLRVSYGLTGREQGVNAFDYLAGYDFGGGGVNDGRSAILDGNYVIGVVPRGLPITNLSWVKSITKNIGFDFAVLNNKITGQFDAFERKLEGLPSRKYDLLLPSEVGYFLPNDNYGQEYNRGVEGMIVYNGKAGSVNYSIGGNATFSRRRDLKTYKPRFGSSWNEYRGSIEDRWGNVNWGYTITGRFQSQEQIDDHPINNDGSGNRTHLPGDFIYKDVNGDKIINFMDERPIGYAEGALPYVSYGINGSVEWKAFSLIFDFAGASMQTFYRDWELRYPYQNNGNAPVYMLEDRWHRADPYDPNSEWISGTYPAIRKDNTGHVNFSRKNDFWLTNIRYMRLKNIELGYMFPRGAIEKIGLSGLRFYVNGTNLFSLDNVKEWQIDPEIGSTNGLVYPQQKLVNIGFNLSL